MKHFSLKILLGLSFLLETIHPLCIARCADNKEDPPHTQKPEQEIKDDREQLYQKHMHILESWHQSSLDFLARREKKKGSALTEKRQSLQQRYERRQHNLKQLIPSIDKASTESVPLALQIEEKKSQTSPPQNPLFMLQQKETELNNALQKKMQAIILTAQTRKNTLQQQYNAHSRMIGSLKDGRKAVAILQEWHNLSLRLIVMRERDALVQLLQSAKTKELLAVLDQIKILDQIKTLQ